MSDDVVVPMRDVHADKGVEMERLNILLDAVLGSLQETSVGDLSDEERERHLDRLHRLHRELSVRIASL